jgi:hypothetical protein
MSTVTSMATTPMATTPTMTTTPMTTTGGKRKMNKSLKAWITFVKKVQKEEKLSYKDAIHRAKVRKDKGEKWMSGGDGTSTGTLETVPLTTETDSDLLGVVGEQLAGPATGGKRRRGSRSRSRSVRSSRKGGRRSRRRASRRH